MTEAPELCQTVISKVRRGRNFIQENVFLEHGLHTTICTFAFWQKVMTITKQISEENLGVLEKGGGGGADLCLL